jgi:hypothetical protein
MVAKLQAIKTELIRRRHEPLPVVREWLQRVTLGYYQYHALPGNLVRLQLFRRRLQRLWRQVLLRRSQRGQISWEQLDRWVSIPHVLHPYPRERFDVEHPRWKPYA